VSVLRLERLSAVLWGSLLPVTWRPSSGFRSGFIRSQKLFDPILQAFRSIPPLAWVPLEIISLRI